MNCWRECRDSNPEPASLELAALPIELHTQETGKLARGLGFEPRMSTLRTWCLRPDLANPRLVGLNESGGSGGLRPLVTAWRSHRFQGGPNRPTLARFHEWSPRRGSNSHARRRRYLKPVCLPEFHHLGVCVGAAGGTRTPHARLFRPALYQMSYRGMHVCD